MDDLLTPVSTTYLKPRQGINDEPLLTERRALVSEVDDSEKPVHISSEDDALDVLKSQPSYDNLISVLRFLNGSETKHGSSPSFNIRAPGPKSAAIVHLLVTEITPNYWTLLSEGSTETDVAAEGIKSNDATMLMNCLRSVTGLNAVLSHLKALIHESKTATRESKRPDIELNLGIFLDVLAAMLHGDEALQATWEASTSKLNNAAMAKTQSHSMVTLVSSGRIPSLASEALTISDLKNLPERTRWISDGMKFSKWVGRNIACWARSDAEEAALRVCSDLVQRGLSLGYFEAFIKSIIDCLLLVQNPQPNTFAKICFTQSASTRRVLQALINYLSRRFLNDLDLEGSGSAEMISAVAGVIATVTLQDEATKTHLIDWCATSSGAGLGDSVAIRRAVVAVLAKDRNAITTVVEKCLAQFGDELYIKHAAILQQQVHAEVLLLSAGCLHRISPIKLTMLLRSGTYLSSISNRIAATQAKARFLGMVVGESLSGLVDGKAKQLDFHMEETDTEEAQRLRALALISDTVGPTTPILSQEVTSISSKTSTTTKSSVHAPRPKGKQSKPKLKTTEAPTPKAIIEEINSSSEDEEEEGLVPYAKHSDPEDSDDDATLVQRTKIKPPVYVRDLITYLRDSENYDKQKLALQTAPVLIRRKANFGTEVSSHAIELARLLVGVQDKFELDDFYELRQQGMVALVVAQPKSMGPWFARTFFEGDYSLSQRTAVLVTLGLSARELAGFEASQYQSAAAFPSKRLPKKMEQMYAESSEQDRRLPASQLQALPATALDSITQSLTSTFLAPIAAEAADANTGPDVLKLESFTARYKSKVSKSKPRVRSIPNTTAALLATSFFSPLTAHFQFALRSSRPIVLNPSLLSLYLQTLGIIIHAAGPSTLSLPQLTSELWDLLLATRTHVLGDVAAMRGWLVAMASLLEVNEGDMRRLCEVQGREVVETREWVGGVFHRTRGGDESGGEESDVKMLAAGVLIKLGEAIEKYQAMLMGDLIGYQ